MLRVGLLAFAAAAVLQLAQPALARAGLASLEALSIERTAQQPTANTPSAQRRASAPDAHAAQLPSGAVLEAWRRDHQRRQQSHVSGDSLLELATAEPTPEEVRASIAKDILENGYGFGAGGGAAAAQGPAAAATAADAVSQHLPQEQHRFAADKPAGDKPGLLSRLGSSALKAGALGAQKLQELDAAKAAAAPKPDQCVMCVYTLERLQQALTPHNMYASRYDRDEIDLPPSRSRSKAARKAAKTLAKAQAAKAKAAEKAVGAPVDRPATPEARAAAALVPGKWRPDSAYAVKVPVGKPAPGMTPTGRSTNRAVTSKGKKKARASGLLAGVLGEEKKEGEAVKAHHHGKNATDASAAAPTAAAPTAAAAASAAPAAAAGAAGEGAAAGPGGSFRQLLSSLAEQAAGSTAEADRTLPYPYTAVDPSTFPQLASAGSGHPDSAPAMQPRPAVHSGEWVGAGEGPAFPLPLAPAGAAAFPPSLSLSAAGYPQREGAGFLPAPEGAAMLLLQVGEDGQQVQGQGQDVPEHLLGHWYMTPPSPSEAVEAALAEHSSQQQHSPAGHDAASASQAALQELRHLDGALSHAYAALAGQAEHLTAGDAERAAAAARGHAELAWIEAQLAAMGHTLPGGDGDDDDDEEDDEEEEGEAEGWEEEEEVASFSLQLDDSHEAGMLAGHWSGSVFIPDAGAEEEEAGEGSAAAHLMLLQVVEEPAEGDAAAPLPSLRTGTPLDGPSFATGPSGTAAAAASAANPGADAAADDVASPYRDLSGEESLFGPHPAVVPAYLRSADNAAALNGGDTPSAPDMHVLESDAVLVAAAGGAAAGGKAGAAPAGKKPGMFGKLAAMASKAVAAVSSAVKGVFKGKGAAPAAAPLKTHRGPEDWGNGNTVSGGAWVGGGDVASQGRTAMTTEDVWWGKEQGSVVAPGYAPDGTDMRAYMPSAAEVVGIKASDEGAPDWAAAAAGREAQAAIEGQIAARSAGVGAAAGAAGSAAAAGAAASSGKSAASLKSGALAGMSKPKTSAAALGGKAARGALPGTAAAGGPSEAEAAAAITGGKTIYTEAVTDAARRANAALYSSATEAEASNVAAWERRRARDALVGKGYPAWVASQMVAQGATGAEAAPGAPPAAAPAAAPAGAKALSSSLGGVGGAAAGKAGAAAPGAAAPAAPADPLSPAVRAAQARGVYERGEAPLGNKAVERLFAAEGLAGATDRDTLPYMTDEDVSAALVRDPADVPPPAALDQLQPFTIPAIPVVKVKAPAPPAPSPAAVAAGAATKPGLFSKLFGSKPAAPGAAPADAAAAPAGGAAAVAGAPSVASALSAAKTGVFGKLFGRKPAAAASADGDAAAAPASGEDTEPAAAGLPSAASSRSAAKTGFFGKLFGRKPAAAAPADGEAAAAPAAPAPAAKRGFFSRVFGGKKPAAAAVAPAAAPVPAPAEAAEAAAAPESLLLETEAVVEAGEGAEALRSQQLQHHRSQRAHVRSNRHLSSHSSGHSVHHRRRRQLSADAASDEAAAAATAEAEAEDAFAAGAEGADVAETAEAPGHLSGDSARFAEGSAEGQGQGEGFPSLMGAISGAVKAVAGAVGALAYPLPHACRSGEALCAQRMRQPSLLDYYRRLRRDEQRAAMNRALVSYSLALDTVCARDTAGLDTDEARPAEGAARTPEEVMAGRPVLESESHRGSSGRFEDQWSYVQQRTRHGDVVGVGSLKHYNMPDPFRSFCAKVRAKLSIVVERFLHGYDEEEVCYALKMCTWDMVRVWVPGQPTSPMAGAAKALGLSKKEAEDAGIQ